MSIRSFPNGCSLPATTFPPLRQLAPTQCTFPIGAANLFAIDLATGAQLWSHQISEYDGYSNAVTRVSPALCNNSLIIGDSIPTPHEGASVIAVSQQTGNLLWITKVDPHPAAIITGSPVVVGNVIYQGISSIEEGLATVKGYACCTFRGSVVALNADTGAILWQTFMVPANNGETGYYSGAAIWQPPAVDVSRSLLYIGPATTTARRQCRKLPIEESQRQ